MLTPQEARKVWVEALRSGKYKQGRTRLHLQKNGEHFFCCLGVACELYMQDGNHMEVSWYLDMSKTYDGCLTDLPEAVQQWLGINSYYGKLMRPVEHNGCEETCLTRLNDVGMPFSEIADIIEQQFVLEDK